MGGDLTFDELFRQEYLPVRRTVALIVGDLEVAAEVTQEAFTQLHLHWSRVSRHDRPGAWVRRVAIRHAVRSKTRARLGGDLEALTSSLEWKPDGHVDLDVIRAIARLPAQQRAAVVLRYYVDLPVADVAVALGCAEPTARVHLHRARARLAELLGTDDEEVTDVLG
jgi:RNA polymerase sigma-70 factor (ECF subfamily)